MSTRPYATSLDVLADLGGHVVRARRRSGITQCQLAQRLGVSQSAVHYVEERGRLPRADTLLTLLAWLDEVTRPGGSRRSS